LSNKWQKEKLVPNDYTPSEETIIIYQRLYPELRDSPHFLFDYGFMLYRAGQYDLSIEILHESSEIFGNPIVYNVLGDAYKAKWELKLAENCYIHASEIVPNLLYPRFLLMQLYLDDGRRDKAVAIAREIVDFKVKVESDFAEYIKEQARNLLYSFEQ